jgi:enoyl-CoA hydratase/carnithine racemase
MLDCRDGKAGVAEQVKWSQPGPGVGQILIDAAPLNILGSEAWQHFEKALEELHAQGSRVVVVGSSVEGYFMAHGSLRRILDVFTGRDAGDVDAQRRVLRALDGGPMVSIAAVDGQAWGGGAELCWACDLRVASSAASFAQPEVNIGLTPGWGGATKVAHLAGEAAALRLILDGRPIAGGEAKELGLVHRLVDAGRALEEAIEWAKWLASRPAWALEANKALVKSTRSVSLRDALRKELETFATCASRPETLALIAAAQDRYDIGEDSYGAFGITPSP